MNLQEIEKELLEERSHLLCLKKINEALDFDEELAGRLGVDLHQRYQEVYLEIGKKMAVIIRKDFSE